MIKTIGMYLNSIRFIFHIILYFLNKKKVDLDINRCEEHHNFPLNGVFGLLYLLTYDKSFRGIFYYRTEFLGRLISFIAPSYESLLINSHAPIDEGALFVHSFSTIINPKSIGKNFRISHGCTIGDSKGGKPTIKDNVVIHPGAMVFGNIIIGNSVTIGAGSLVSKSVPDNCTVVGNPAYIIFKNGIRTKELL